MLPYRPAAIMPEITARMLPAVCQPYGETPWYASWYEYLLIHHELTMKIVMRSRHSLSLEIVHIASIHHVTGVDKELSPPHGFNEVCRSAHLSHKFYEKLCTPISVYALQKSVDGANEATWIRKRTVVDDWWVFSGLRIWSDCRRINC